MKKQTACGMLDAKPKEVCKACGNGHGSGGILLLSIETTQTQLTCM